MSKIAINGSFFQSRITGMERFSIEIIKELDKICPVEKYELIVPKYIELDLSLNNITIVKYGKLKGKMWTQIDFGYYILKNGMIPLSLNSIVPVLKPGVVCIHDITFRVNKELFKENFRSKISVLWRNFQYKICFKYSPLIFTVSEFSKTEMLKFYSYNPNQIVVLGNGWNHMTHIVSDSSIIKRYPNLLSKPFFFSLNSLAENKNIKWIIESASFHPQYNFIIGGGTINKFGESFKKEGYTNIHFVGYLSDGEIKFLMQRCKAFIFPSVYEGFGIPPLEALSVGAKIIISKSACLPEIFGGCAYYIDPYTPCNNFDDLLKKEVSNKDVVLNMYSWNTLAKKMIDSIENLKM